MSSDDSRPSESIEESLAAWSVWHALKIYALASLEGPLVGLTALARDSEGAIRVHAEAAMGILASLASSCYISHLLWPILIAGSCMIEPEHCQAFSDGLAMTRYKMRNVAAARKVLELLWADSDPEAYGPHGLLFITQKHGLEHSWI